jgi:hypothetical protein
MCAAFNADVKGQVPASRLRTWSASKMLTTPTTAIAPLITPLSPTEEAQLVSALEDSDALWTRAAFFVEAPPYWSKVNHGPPIPVAKLYVPFAQVLGQGVCVKKVVVSSKWARFVVPKGAEFAIIDINALSDLSTRPAEVDQAVAKMIETNPGHVQYVCDRTIANVKRLQLPASVISIPSYMRKPPS